MIIVNCIASVTLMVLGFYTIVTKKNIMKIVIGMGIVDYGVNLLIISIGFNPGGTAPIFSIKELTPQSFFVDPVPQALTLTSIVIGACVTAMALSIVIRIKQRYKTLNADEIRRLRG